MGQALPKPALRPFLAGGHAGAGGDLRRRDRGVDRRRLQRGAAGGLGGAADDEEQFGKTLAGELTLIATLQNSPVGFASLKGADHIDMLYVHPSAAGQGVGVDAVRCAGKTRRRAAAPRASRSMPATTRRSSFAKRGYVAKQRNTVTVNGEWLANTTMQKTLAEAQRRERRHEPRTPLSVRHHAARRRADQRRRFHAA